MAVKGGDTAVMKVIWDLSKDNLTTEELKYKLLLVTNNYGNKVWHMAVKGGDTAVMKVIWVWLKTI
jgi:hypothetical protein